MTRQESTERRTSDWMVKTDKTNHDERDVETEGVLAERDVIFYK